MTEPLTAEERKPPAIDCISCGRPNGDPSQQMPKMHVRCWLNIPQVTRNQYVHGGITDLRRLVEASQRANSSVKKYGGGHGR